MDYGSFAKARHLQSCSFQAIGVYGYCWIFIPAVSYAIGELWPSQDDSIHLYFMERLCHAQFDVNLVCGIGARISFHYRYVRDVILICNSCSKFSGKMVCKFSSLLCPRCQSYLQ